MTIAHTIETAIAGLTTHKSRSLLTILGIVIGIASIILIMSLGRGAEKLIVNQIGGFGAEIIAVRPGKEPKGPTDLGDTLFADSLKEKDVSFLKRKENVPDLAGVMPILIVSASASFEGETFRPMILGGAAEFFSQSFSIYPESGTLFGENDIASRAHVAVIGFKVKNELFGDGDALGKQIKIKSRKFRVVGVLPDKGQGSFFNFNELVLIPYTTAQTYLLGTDHFHEILVRAKNPESVPRVVEDIESTLRASHNIDDPDKDDFFTVTQQGIVEQVKSIIGALTAFLSSVVAIALVVGGIGVMNIMLVAVAERTKEIGLRKAIGATDKDILRQFLFEAIILTGVGGILGIMVGALLSVFITLILTHYMQLQWAFSFPVGGALAGVVVSTLVGLVFGIYPARQASKKSPIEALRYE